MSRTRPNFVNPPLVEQAITAAFDPIEGFSFVHVGEFWSLVKNEFPQHDHQLPIETAVERDELRQSIELDFRVVPATARLPRMMFRNDQELIQLQQDRFSFNWTKASDESEYPRWEKTYARFRQLYHTFNEYLSAAGLAEPNLRQCEVTNVNIIPVADFGSSFADICSAFAVDPLGLHVPFLVPETYTRVRQHRIVNNDGSMVGRLHTVLQPVFSSENGEPAFRLELTARSLPKTDTVGKIEDFLKIARDSINAGFMGITNNEMRARWGETP
ncbi:TIGR04255 family protein [Sphingorhabdus sp.]|uniref:TIGR04255 family protein n=1 Tax=Sphingorhabdus sp. TaxID=1902408 RepID=UPI0032B74062